MNQSNNIIFSSNNQFLWLFDKSICDLIEEHLQKYKEKEKHHTYRAYKKDIYDFFKYIKVSQPEELAQIPFANLTRLYESYLNHFKKVKEKTTIITNTRTLNRKAYSLKKFFDYIIFAYNYPKNPLKEFQPYNTEKQTTTKSINERDLLNIIHHTKETYNKAEKINSKLSKLQTHLIICFLTLSLRRSEVSNLQWQEINEEEKYIKVFQKGQTYKFIPIPKPVFDLLTTFKSLKLKNWYNNQFIFSPIKTWNYDKGKAINNNYIFWLVKRLCNKLSIQWNITPHSFRTAFVKKALDKWIWFIDIMNATGHSSMELVKYYDTRDKVDNNAINNMEDLFY